jgi:predicted phosphodiesterase
MKLQYFSDIHLEFGPMQAAAPDADVIVAAGDIDVGTAGVEWLIESGKPTIYVAGNHEYYGGEIGDVQRAIRAAARGTNVYYLEREARIIGDVRFLGATLWTDFMGDNRELMATLKDHMNDYQQIHCGERLLEPNDLAQFNLHTRAWLEKELSHPFAGKTVIVTHHAPLFASWRSTNSPMFKGAYCNDLSALILQYPIDLWIHGHVHARSDYRANELRVVCNPRGYDGYQLVDGFDNARVIEL